MKKSDLVAALRDFAEQQCGRSRGQNVLAYYFAYWFDRLEISADQQYDFWEIDNRIAQLLVSAVEELLISESSPIKRLREMYELETEHSIPDPMDITGDGIDQALFVQSLGFLFHDVTAQNWISGQIGQVFNAQRHLLMQRVYVFVDKVYTRGLAKFIHDTQERGMSGTVGETTIRTYYVAGRQLITFARPSTDEAKAEHSMTLICGEDDPLALGIGTQSIFTDFQTALAMLDDVITNWPDELEQAWMLLAPDDQIGIC